MEIEDEGDFILVVGEEVEFNKDLVLKIEREWL